MTPTPDPHGCTRHVGDDDHGSGSLSGGDAGQTQGTKEPLSREKLWQEVGFHKALGGWWFGLIFLFINIFTGIFVTSMVASYFYRYPSSIAYINATNTLFALLFFTFDIGTAGLMNRFIPEARISDPTRMIYYIRYFVWYQMVTGLAQLTIVAVYCIHFATQADIAYLTWIMLIISTRQYPGMLGVFNNLLNTFQYYGRSKIVSFTQGEIFQRLTELLFVWGGMAVGKNNPQIGVLMGVSLGLAIGQYADDFIGMAIGAYFFRDIIHEEGFRVVDCFIPRIPWSVVKPVLSFAVRTSIPGLTANVVNLYVFTLYLTHVHQWVIFSALVGIAGGITSDMEYARLDVGPLYNEAYMNGKKVLAQTVLMKTFRFSAQLLGFFFAVFAVVWVIIPDAFEAFRLYYYYAALGFIIPCLVRNALNIALGQSGSILYAANKPNLILAFSYANQVAKVVFHTVLVLHSTVLEYPWGMMFLLVFAGGLVDWVFAIAQHVYIHFRVFKIRVARWQTLVVPLLSCVTTTGIAVFFYRVLYLPLRDLYGFFVGVIPFILIMLLVALVLFFPITAAFGGWDDGSVAEFEKVVEISGPSKWLVSPMFRILKRVCAWSPLHGRFPLDDEAALRESRELDALAEAARGGGQERKASGHGKSTWIAP
ncbi:MAG: hypothetical protein ACTSU5_04580 [Promethearchaeota archaeon]